mgnify:CR=1 FL=1
MSSNDINYTKEALFNTWNLIFLATAAGLAVGMSVVSGLPTWLLELFLVMAGGVELMYLGIMPRNKRFQRHVRSQKMAEQNKPPSQRERFNQLRNRSQRRYTKLRKLRDQIQANYQQLSYASQGILDSHVKKIDGLLESYLDLLHQRERHRDMMDSSTENELRRTIKQLRQDMADDSERVRAVKQRRLRVLKQRLARTHKAKENLEILGAQLGTIEDAVKYIHEQSWTLQNADEVSYQLDALLEEVEETQVSVRQIEDVFRHPGDFLDDDPLEDDLDPLEDDLDALDDELNSVLDDPLDEEDSVESGTMDVELPESTASDESSASDSSRSRVRP